MIIIWSSYNLTSYSLTELFFSKEVDVVSKAPIPAFCSSDEEDEDKEALLYLPIAPEIEDPEDNWVPVK